MAPGVAVMDAVPPAATTAAVDADGLGLPLGGTGTADADSFVGTPTAAGNVLNAAAGTEGASEPDALTIGVVDVLGDTEADGIIVMDGVSEGDVPGGSDSDGAINGLPAGDAASAGGDEDAVAGALPGLAVTDGDSSTYVADPPNMSMTGADGLAATEGVGLADSAAPPPGNNGAADADGAAGYGDGTTPPAPGR